MECNKLVWHLMGANVSCYVKILAFSDTQFERECPHGGQTTSAEMLQTFAVLQTLSKSPNLKKKWTKFRKLHFGHVMRREKLEHLVTSGMIVEKQCQKLLNGLTK